MTYIILALTIFTMLALSFNQKGNSDLDTRLYHQAVVVATEMGDALLNEISQLPFDAATVSDKVSETSELTSAGGLGPSPSEKGKKWKFNDVDDFNGYQSIDSLGLLGVCTTDVWVAYINPDNDDTHLGYQTWYKKIVVHISGDYLQDPIRLKYITSY